MLHRVEPAEIARSGRPARHSPAVPVALALAVGILLDSRWSLAMSHWILLGTTLLALSAGLGRRRCSHAASAGLLSACAALGGAWHHWHWECVVANEIGLWARDEDQIVRLTGKVIERPLCLILRDESPWQVPERTAFLLECRSLDRPGESQPVAGRVRVTVVGRVDLLEIGDLVALTGRLSRPEPPANPGEFDLPRWLRAQGIHAVLRVVTPEAIVVSGQERSLRDQVARVRAGIRQRAEHLMSSRLSPETAPVAQSLLLGTRSGLDEELRRAFAESGTLHVLAISGMNVGLLWAWMWFLFRMLRYPPGSSLLVILVLLPGYAFITDANPPVVRATIVAMVLAWGQLIRRQSNHWNSLALAAILVLGWRPSDLFNPGAQLSFIAVASILLAAGATKEIRETLAGDESPSDGSAGIRALRWLIRRLIESGVIGLAVWTTTSPLIAAQYHLVSPIGFVLNVVLSPLIAVMFWLGYSFLLLGLISPEYLGGLGTPFDLTLGWFLGAVRAAAELKMGHSYVSAPPLWWTVGFYLVTVLLVTIDHWRGTVFWSPRGLLAWSVAGLLLTLRPTGSQDLRCTVLAVKHGLSILIELPGGTTLLYDAGSMLGRERTAQIIQRALWANGQTRLDAVIVSHADADHCNAIPRLAEVIPIGQLMVHRTFLDWSQQPVAEAIEQVSGAGIPVRLISAGHRIEIAPGVLLEVLHPSPAFQSPGDNANSLVLCMEYAGRRILLTGDLENDGLYHLLLQPPRDVDVLLAPHHGSVTANPADLARWARPEWLIASSRDAGVIERLEPRFGPATQVLATARDGAIQCRITPQGELQVETFRSRRSEPAPTPRGTRASPDPSG